MAYRCDQAIFGGMRDAIRCKVSGYICAHQKMCMMEGRMVLTDKAMECPARGGRMPEAETEAPVKKAAKVERVEKVPDIDAAADAQAKTRGQKPAAAADEPAKKRGRKPTAEKAAAEAPARKVTAKADAGTARKVTAKKTTTGRKKA